MHRIGHNITILTHFTETVNVREKEIVTTVIFHLAARKIVR